MSLTLNQGSKTLYNIIPPLQKKNFILIYTIACPLQLLFVFFSNCFLILLLVGITFVHNYKRHSKKIFK